MHAGSSRDTGNQFNGLVIPITEPPVVEIDTEATAAYIWLRETVDARKEPFPSEHGLVILDFAMDGNAVAIEVVGQQEFSIRERIKLVPVQPTKSILRRARHVSAKLHAARMEQTNLIN